MFTRTFNILTLALITSACGGGSADDANVAAPPEVKSLAQAEEAAKQQLADDGMVACAVAGATQFTRTCQIERNQEARGLVLTIRHPDGGFRRLLVTKDGRGVVAADGSEPAVVTPINPKEIEVVLAGNRYRLGATVKTPAAPVAPAAPAATAAPAPAAKP
jgi:hypothetical protein